MGRVALTLAFSTGLAATALLAGCTVALPPHPRATERPAPPVGTVVEGFECVAPEDAFGRTPQPTPTPTSPPAGTLPAGFDPVAAVLCSPGWVTDAPDAHATMTETRYEGDLRPLLRALAEPDAPVPANLVCTAIGEIVPPLWLVDAAGRGVRMYYPRTACGLTKDDASKALKSLHPVSSTTTRR